MGEGKAQKWKIEILRIPPSEVAILAAEKQLQRYQRKAISPSILCGSMLFALGLISLLTGHVTSDIEWYSQRLVKRALYSKSDRSHEKIDIWRSQSSKFFCGCSDRGPHFPCPVRESSSSGYLLIATSGGLNQQRIGIIDAVVVARILNATLVIPELDHHSFWKDNSDFFNIFDVDWFISSLSRDVTAVKRIPDKVMRSMGKPPYTMRVPRKSTPEYYMDQVLPILLRRRAVQLTKFDYRLSNKLDDELQKLRCRVNYHALRFTKPIRELGRKIVKRMQKMSSHFIAVHLRFEPDMLAFSGCYYGGGDKERNELGAIRKRWVTLPDAKQIHGLLLAVVPISTLSNWTKEFWEWLPEMNIVVYVEIMPAEEWTMLCASVKKMDLSPEGERKRGKCPLTPHEVGLMLQAIGFGNDSYLYIASGEIYGGEETLKPLKNLFPNLYTKEMLANRDLEPFLPFSSRLAAIDYIVCDESDVFVTNNNGNMAKILAGRRRYMGHKRTIRPNAKKLSSLLQARHVMDWKTFAKKVKSCQRGFMGEPEEMKLGRDDFYELPSTCICRKPYGGNGGNFNNTDLFDRENIDKESLNRLSKESTVEERSSSSSDENTDQEEFLPD